MPRGEKAQPCTPRRAMVANAVGISEGGADADDDAVDDDERDIDSVCASDG